MDLQLFSPVLVIAAMTFIPGSLQAKVLDVRNASDADGARREVSICARPSPAVAGLPGHVFVAFSVEKSGQRTFRAVGHTAFSVTGALVSYTGLLPTPGALVDENYTSLTQQCLTLVVNKGDFDNAYAAALQPLQALGVKFDESKPIALSYVLGSEDCMTFATAIAGRFKAKGVKVPPRAATDLPIAYVRKLIDGN